MLFDILPLKNNTARLIRVYGDEPCIAVPGEVPATPQGVRDAVNPPDGPRDVPSGGQGQGQQGQGGQTGLFRHALLRQPPC